MKALCWVPNICVDEYTTVRHTALSLNFPSGILPNCCSWFSFTFIWQLMPSVEFIQWYVHITTVDCWPMPYLKCSDRTYFFRKFSSNAFSPTLDLVLHLFDSWCRVWSSSSDVHITTVDCWPMPYLKCSGRMLFSILFFGNSLPVNSPQLLLLI